MKKRKASSRRSCRKCRRTRSNSGFQPDRSCRLLSLLVFHQARCPVDETSRMHVVRDCEDRHSRGFAVERGRRGRPPSAGIAGSAGVQKVTQASSLTGRAGFSACSCRTRQDARWTRQAGCMCYVTAKIVTPAGLPLNEEEEEGLLS